MNRIFSAGKGIAVPDGTVVFPFLNPRDTESGLPPGLFEGFSIAMGEIAPHSRSAIHRLRGVTQAVFVLEGRLTLTMRDPDGVAPYTLELAPEQAAVQLPGTRLQLANGADAPCRVLYVVSPAYRYETGPDGRVVYEDAEIVEGWHPHGGLR